jgi:adenosylhomocysteine nucleosidase
MHKLGILSAMEEETLALEHQLEEAQTIQWGRWIFHEGRLAGFPVVMGRSGWGKVAAAAYTQSMIDRFGVDGILFIGVAGGLNPYIRRGDIVVATGVAQHDINARPFFPQGEIPLLGQREIASANILCENAYRACTEIIQQVGLYFYPTELAELGIEKLKVHLGLALTGDQVIFNATKKTELLALFPEALSVDMESAAVGQVCHALDVPFAVVRIISDAADEQGEDNFSDFVERFVNRFTKPIVQDFVKVIAMTEVPRAGWRK